MATFYHYLAIFMPSWVSQWLDPIKPYYLQAFEGFTLFLFPFYLLILVNVQLGGEFEKTLHCDYFADMDDYEALDELADTVCMLEEGFTADYRIFQPNGGLVKRPDRKPHYYEKYGRLYPVVVPGIAPINRSMLVTEGYSYMTTVIWLDVALVIQVGSRGRSPSLTPPFSSFPSPSCLISCLLSTRDNILHPPPPSHPKTRIQCLLNLCP